MEENAATILTVVNMILMPPVLRVAMLSHNEDGNEARIIMLMKISERYC